MRETPTSTHRDHPLPTLAALEQAPLFADHPDAMVLCRSADAIVLAINASACQMFGTANRSVAGLPLSEWLPPGAVQELIASHPGNPLRRVVIEAVPHPHGQRTVEFSARHLQTADGWVVVLTLHDVTAHREAERALRLSHQRFETVSQATSDAVWDLDVATGSIWWNERYFAIFGLDAEREAATLEGWRSRVHPDDLQRVSDSLNAVLAGSDNSWQAHYRFRRGDGSWAYVSDRGLVLRGPDGQPVRMVGGVTDETEQVRTAEHMLRTQRLESIGTLAGGIAHDLNNILAPISMSAQLIAERLNRTNAPVDPDELLEWVHVIDDAARRGTSLVKQVLLFARGEEGERQPLNPRRLLRDLARIVRETFPKDIALRVLSPEDGWWLEGDATQLQQVLLNLAVNARDAMPGGGRLTLAASNVTLHEAMAQRLALQLRPGRYVRLSVEDTGCGIPPKQLARIFDPFFTTKPVGKGTGLGLSTAMTIVRAHNGQLRVESLEQVGTTFELWLPATQSALPVETVARAAPAGRGEGILIVDDEEPIREVLHALLTRSGYRVWTARHGAEALEVLERLGDAVQLVLTDLTMPVLDGAALAAALAQRWPRLPIVATSGLVGDLPDGPQIPSGVRAFFAKPFDSAALLQTLADILRPV